MGNGAVGGLVGARLGRALEARYGKRRSDLWGGLISLLVALIAFSGYTEWDPPFSTDYARLDIAIDGVRVYGGHRLLELTLVSGAEQYRLGSGVWHGRYETEELVAHLRQSGRATIWIDHTSRVQGLKTDRVVLGPEIGAALEATNRKALLWLSIGFFVLGVWGVASGLRASKAVQKR